MITMKRLDDTLRILTAFLFAFLCLLSAAFASEEAASATDVPEEVCAEETPAPEVEEPPVEETPAPTPEPVNYEYDITIMPPSGWYLTSADVQITIRDPYDYGWDSAVFLRFGTKGGTNITSGSATISISDNDTYTVRVTDPSGGVHEESLYIECFDTTAPSVSAGIQDKVLHAEASDSQSGVYGIQVDGNLYTTLQNGAVDIRLKDYTEAGKTLTVVAIDNLGNRSPQTVIDNPYYTDATPSPEGTNAPVIIYTGSLDDPQPTTAPAPTAAPVQSQPTVPAVTTPVSEPAATPVSTTVTNPVPNTTADETEETPAPTPEPEEITIEPGEGFSEPGNGVTRDLLYDKHTNKQFVTVQTRQGNVFYLVIDYDKVSDEDEEQYQTYFLNPVDEADLLALLDDDAISALTGSGEAAEEPLVCTCADKCAVGHIDTTCPVCRTDISRCTGVETVTPTPEPTPEPEEEPEPEPAGNKSGGIVAVVLILGILGGGVFYFLKNKKAKPQTTGDTDVFDYDYDEDEEIEENEEDPEHDRSRDS